jgi:hypothetical protein
MLMPDAGTARSRSATSRISAMRVALKISLLPGQVAVDCSTTLRAGSAGPCGAGRVAM